MSIALTSFLQAVSIQLGDHLASTTTSAGNTDKTTLIDSALIKYPDGYFGDPNRDPEWWAYVGSALRSVKQFVGSTGTIIVHHAYSSQVASSTAYSLHKFDRDKKILACNQALIECYPDFYKRAEDATTLDGTGSSANKYEVPSTFMEFPDQIWKHHTGDTTTFLTHTPITDFMYENIGGKWYFYANITTGDDIYLVGKTLLTQFTNDASTTELTTGEANTVAYLAASIFCRTQSGIVSAADSGRFDSMANRFRGLYEQNAMRNRMPLVTSREVDFNWLDE